MASNAVGSERVSRVVGYTIGKGDFSTTSPNLPQRIAILAEANTANQSGLTTTGVEVTTAQQAGQLYGYGSPIHRIMSILRPNSGGVVGGIPTVVYAQEAAVSSVAKVLEVTATGTATASGTHTLNICGRDGLNGVFYDINIVTGDTPTAIATKAKDAINAVLGSPVAATSALGVVTATAKWTGLTSNDISITVDTNDTALGVTWAVAQTTAGSGTPSIADALDSFGANWNTIVVNSYGTVTAIMDALEAYNGIPDPTLPTGRYTGIIMKPFIAITGSTVENPSSITDTRLNNVTIAIAPAPLSAGLPMEAAANMAAIYSRIAQDSPQRDVCGQAYIDMPTPSAIGAMSNYDNRDAIVKKGCSTVDLVAGQYVIQDFVTTYHPLGETPPQFRYCRNLMLDFNVRFGYYLLEQIYVVDHVIAADGDDVSADFVIKPKQWKGVVSNYAIDLAKRALVADAEFMQDSINVAISGTNPDRLDTTFSYKRTGTARISATTAKAGFNFGS